MKRFRMSLAVAVLFAILVVPTVASADPRVQVDDPRGFGPGSGRCLSQYNSCNLDCDSNPLTIGPFMKLGCKADCLAQYYDCVLASALN